MRYEFLGSLGEGSFGTVFEALDRVTGERLAVKELVRANAQSLARFKQEFRALSTLHHPNLVELRELFEHEGRWFIAMELLSGDDFLEATRGKADNWQHSPHDFDEARLRLAVQDVARGLSALHQHGFLHRDLKPSNIMVTHEGRAVLLDFGLVTATDPLAQSTAAGGIGTAAYMAPEQAAGRKIGPEADWYALGVCIYEALAGRLPFTGETSLQLMMAKQGARPAPPSAHALGLPEDLERICLALLEPTPDGRMETARQLAVEGGAVLPASVGEDPAKNLTGLTFAGREDQLLQLEQAFEKSQQGELTIVLVEGESGVGKSALVTEFLRQHQGRHPDAILLKGRCYENERVPFKAFDGCMDELSKVLKRLPRERCVGLLPRRAALLTQLFPVLREVEALRRASLQETSADPTARRLEAFAAMAGLFRNLTKEHPLILVIDDVQWADVESFRMLRALVEDHDRPPLLLLCTVRPRSELDSEVAEALEVVRSWLRTSVVSVQGLPMRQARELAAQLLTPGAPAHWLESIAIESKGHPLFIGELVQYVRSHDLGAAGSLTLEAALSSRIERLDRNARQLLELVALAGRPYGAHVLARALGWQNGLGDASKRLLMEKLLLLRRDQQLMCFHDRIRHTVVRQLPKTKTRVLHRQLAEVLDSLSTSDVTERAHHWDEAGEFERAIGAYELAAQAAVENLAFARAEQCCRRALELVGDSRDERARRLLVQRGHALSRSGRSAEAAQAYDDAARGATGEERVRLRVRVAQQLIQSAQVDAGMSAARSVLEELGATLPEGAASAVARIAWDRTCLAARGLSVTTRATADVPAEQRLLLDALADLSFPVSWLELLPGAAINSGHLRRALAAGERAHVVRALCNETMFRVMQNPAHKAGYQPLLERSRALLLECGAPELEGFQLMVEGTAAGQRFELTEAHERLVAAQELFQTRCAGEPWYLTNVRMSLGNTWFEAGEHARLARQSELWLAEARERQDRFAVAALMGLGCGCIRMLMRDEPRAALEQLREAMAPWPALPFSLAHLGEVVGVSWVELYRGEGAAFRWHQQHRARFDQAFLLRSGVGKVRLAGYRALSGLAALAEPEASGDGRVTIMRSARAEARRLERLGTPLSVPMAALVFAQLDAVAGQASSALAHARAAREALARMGHFLQHPAAYLEGTIEAGDGGREKCNQALSFFREQGWRNPQRAMGMVVPVLPLLGHIPQAAAKRARDLVHGRYELLRTLGDGSSGAVVEARDHFTGQRLALKELVRPAPASLARFKREFRALQDLHHPNLVRLEALFEDQGRWFIAMELVEGVDWLSWVRPAASYDDARLRSTLRGLAEGLLALHGAGLLHCDLTPFNVRVTPEGRCVILDFGLVTAMTGAVAHHATTAGTPAYMAPEQVRGGTLSPAVDAYALGSCLYQALTGRIPFDAPVALDLLRMKQGALPAAPSSTVKVGADLERWCMELLAPEPDMRLTLPTLLDELSPQSMSLHGTAPPVSLLPARPLFVGRQRELEQLETAFSGARAGRCAVVIVEGESGLGKTALVSEMVRRVRERDPEVLVLDGRCYENEQVAYKALDGVMDELGRLLVRLSPAACRALLPPRVAALGQLFPGLAIVPAIAQAPTRMLSADPTARRLEAFVALRELFGNLCRTQPVLVAIDDLQWADADSFSLLRALVEGGGPLALMVVGTVRLRAEIAHDVAEPLEGLRKSSSAFTIALKGLSGANSRELAAQLLGPDGSTAEVDAISTECQGHPLFLGELALYANEARGSRRSRLLSLDESLAARVRRLDPEARALLELVALGGRPYGGHVFARVFDGALGGNAKLSTATTALLARRLVRVSKDHGLVCDHDRIRRAVLANVSEADTRRCCALLATALEGELHTDPAELARLWDLAGDATRAIAAYEAAANRAMQSLAFSWAEQRYARALCLLGDVHDSRWHRLFVERGHALARSGRSAEAALVYQEAAAASDGEVRVRLGIQAAQQLLQSAQLAPGMAAVRALLASLDMPLPTGIAAALGQLGWDRLCLGVRGLDVKVQAEGAVSVEERLRLDVLAAIGFPVAWVELLPGATINSRHLRRALAAQEPAHVVRALCNEATFRAVQSPSNTGSYMPLFESSRVLLRSCSTPQLEAFQLLTEGAAAMFRYDLTEAHGKLVAAHEELKTRCAGEPWLLTNARLTLGGLWFQQGAHARVSQESELWLAEARERHDAFALAALSGLGRGFARLLMRHEPDAAEHELRQAMKPWDDGAFTLAHWGELVSTTWTRLYRGGNHALLWLEERSQRLDKAFVMRTAAAKQDLFAARALAGLAALADASAELRPSMLRRVHEDARRLTRLDLPLAMPMADLLQAQLAALAGDCGGALVKAQAAHAGFAKVGVFFQHHAAYFEGRLNGGEAGREQQARALAFFREQGWLKPERAIAMALPALELVPAP